MTACPNCRATVRPGAPFCSLCHTDFRPPPPPTVVAPPQPAPVQAHPASAVDPLTAPLLDVVLPPAAVPLQPTPGAELPVAAVPAPRAAEPRWPCQTCGASNPLSLDLCAGCGASFLAAARERMSVVLPGVGDLMSMSRGQRLAIAGGGAVLVGMLPVLFAVLGKLV